MKMKRLVPLLLLCLVGILCIQSVCASDIITVDFYYSSTCGTCKAFIPIVEQVEEHYERNNTNTVVFHFKEVGANATNYAEMRARGLSFPSVLINNQTKIPKINISYDFLVQTIDAYLKNLSINETDHNIIEIPFFGRVNLTQFSLPVLTVMLGAFDSFNPCSFFILIFLLSLLINLRSRRRMLLVGLIFIFFSGFFYFLFMAALLTFLMFIGQYITLLTIIIGLVACGIGLLNMKDFFFFKQGPSLSIPDEKRSKTFKRMRNLVKTPSLLAMLGGTIFLAVTVNFYELLCTLGFPFAYTGYLQELHLPQFDYYLYIFFYCVVYVIPLIIILLIFAITLGKRKISEWQGRSLKLLSGLMIFSFGILFIIDYKLLENVLTPVALLGISILVTLLIMQLWKKFRKEPPQSPPEEIHSDENF